MHLVCAGRTLCLFWALHHKESIQKDDIGDYRTHDSVSCTHHMVLLVLLAAVNTLLVSLEADVCNILSCSLVALHHE